MNMVAPTFIYDIGRLEQLETGNFFTICFLYE